MSETISILSRIDQEFVLDAEDSVFNMLFMQYERIIFSSIITAFGLELFISDQYGGDVDTILNVRKIGSDPQIHYKNESNAAIAAETPVYDREIGKTYMSDPAYKDQNAQMSADRKTGELVDAYTGKQVPINGKVQLDHVISRKEIHNDSGRILAGVSGIALANSPENLMPTDYSINGSKNAKSVEEFIQYLERTRSKRITKIGEIKDKLLHPQELSFAERDKLQKELHKLEELESVDIDRLRRIDEKAHEEYEKKIAKAYYLDLSNPSCRRFYLDTAKAATKRGVQMGARQVIGFMLTEVWFSIKDELSLLEDRTPRTVLDSIMRGIKKGFINAKEEYRELISKFGEGLVSGIIGSLSTTLCNVLFTTSQNFGRVIRQAWSSIVEATKIILFNPQNKWLSDRLTDAMKVLASGAAVIIGSAAQDVTQVKLSMIPAPLNSIIPSFSGSLCTGLLSVTFLFYIDHNPFGLAIDTIYNPAIQSYQEQARLFVRYCAELKKYNVDEFAANAEKTYSIAIQLCCIQDDNELNSAIKAVMEELHISPPWGEGTLDDFMNDPTRKLVFE